MKISKLANRQICKLINYLYLCPKQDNISMIKLHITNETNRLEAVILGTATSNGPTPKLEEAYDPKSAEHIKAGTYPIEKDMVAEMDAFRAVLEK